MKLKSSTVNWSEYQKAIFKEIAEGSGHIIVIARAGVGKTHTLVEGSRYLPKGSKALFCAFNKSIQEELKLKLKSTAVDCMTLHSLGFRGIRQRFGSVEVNERKCWNIVSEIIDDPKHNYDLIESICKTVGFCKNTLTDTPTHIEELIYKYEIDTCEIEIGEFIKYVSSALRLNKEKTSEVDYNDMVWFPFIYHINLSAYSHVFIDEAHDLNKAQIELALSAIKKGGRIFTLCDPNQAIYSWRGADVSILDSLRKRLNAKEMSLPICYRCCKSVARKAKDIVPDILPYENNIEGEIIDINTSQLIKYINVGDYLVSRYNAPLIKYCLSFLKNHIPANILGRDISSNLLNMIKKSKKKTIPDFLKWLDKWEKTEKEKLLNKFPDANTDGIKDKADCLFALCEEANSIQEVKDNIDNLFTDKSECNIITLSSIHRIKGKESDNVFILADTLNRSSQEELNIQYVAITRAKKKLYMVWKKRY